MNEAGFSTCLQGIRTPNFYLARSKTQFLFHQEDFGLGSISICFYADENAFKLWIVLAPDDEENFNNICKKIYPEFFKSCENPVHQKVLYFHFNI
jgi:hypothetical protein